MVKKQRSKRTGKFIKQGNLVSDDIFIPNHSGEHTAGTTGTPTTDRSIANKAYVDTEILTAWLKTLGQTGLTGDKSGSFNLSTTGNISGAQLMSSAGIRMKGTTFTAGFDDDDNLTTFNFLGITSSPSLIITKDPGFFTFSHGMIIGGELFIPTRLKHTGDADTYLDFGLNQIILTAGGSSGLFMNTGNVSLGDFFNDMNTAIVGNFKNAMTYDWGNDDFNFTSDLFFSTAGSGLPYGSMYNDNTATTVAIVTAGTFVRIPSGFTVGQLNNATFANAREITVLKPGKYKIDYSISFNSDGGANLDMEGAIGIDNTKNAQGTAHRLIGAGNDIGNIAGTAILDLSANAVVSLMMTNNTNDTNIIVDHASLSVLQVGG